MKIKAIILAIFCLLIVTPLVSQPLVLYHAENIEQSTHWTTSYTDSSPILIEHDDNFTTLGFSGDGSETTPFVIDDLNITSDATCIIVRNTRAYFKIANCYFAPEIAEYSTGVIFENVTNAYVGSNIFSDKATAMQWHNVNDSICEDNEIVGNVNFGLDITSTYNCDVVQNQVWGNDDYLGVGIQVSSSYYCNIFGNEVANSFTGIKLMTTSNCTIEQNQLHDFSYGPQGGMGYPAAIEVSSAPDTEIIENTISDSPVSGISMVMPNSVDCRNNILTGCGLFPQGIMPGNPGFSTDGDLVNNKPVLYIWNQTHLDIDGTQYAQVILHEAKFCTITGGEFNEASVGIQMSYSTNCTVENAEASGNHFSGALQFFCINCTFDTVVFDDNSRFQSVSTYSAGVWLYMTQNGRVINCEISDSQSIGLFIAGSPGSVLSNNVFLRNGILVLGLGMPAVGDYYLVEDNNLINGKQFGYFYNDSDVAVDGSLYGQILVVNSSRITVAGGDFSEATSGVAFILSDNCTLTDAAITKNSYFGIQIVSSRNTSIIRNVVEENPYSGIYNVYSESSYILNNSVYKNGLGLPENQVAPTLSASSYDVVAHNRISHNHNGLMMQGSNITVYNNNISCNYLFGIYAVSANFFNITKNIVSGNFYLDVSGPGIPDPTLSGIYISSGPQGVIRNNSVYSNGGYGIALGSMSAENIDVYWNEVGWNAQGNALDGGISNLWDDDDATGNAWSDYVGSGTYPIPFSSSVDRYPSTLTDGTTPTVDSPSDEIFEAGTSGNELVWHASDNYPGRFVVYRNGTVIANRTWCFEPIEVELDPLDVGSHNLTIVVYDGAGNHASDMVIVDAVDTISPTIDSPNDIEYVAGSTGNNIEWYGSDLFPASYEVFIDDVSTESGPWGSSTEPITVNVDGLVAGEHNCTIVLTDQGGNTVSDTVVVVVTEPPTTPTTPTTTTTTTPSDDEIPPMTIILALTITGVFVMIVVIALRMKR